MLETMRRNSRSLLIYLLFGILIAVFVLTFGSPGQGMSCSEQPSHVAKVDGRDISVDSWRFMMNMHGYGSGTGARARAERRRERIMDGLIEREVLALAAEKEGFRVSTDEVEAKIARGEMYIFGQPVDGKFVYFERDKAGIPLKFNYDVLERWVTTVGLPNVPRFVDEQRKELMALKMRELLAASVRVSPEEVERQYIDDNSKVVVDYVKLIPANFRDKVAYNDADVEVYAKVHDEELKKKYEAEKDRWMKRGKEVRLRHVFFPRTEGLAEGATDPQLAKAQQALGRVKGGADFAQVAQEMSEDKATAKKGGLVDWRNAKALGYGEEFATALDKLEIGKIGDEVIQTPRGFHVVKVEGRREGDLAYEQVRAELAERGLVDERSRELARKAADEALAAAQGGKSLAELYPDTPEDPDAPAADFSRPKAVAGAEIKRSGALLSGGSGRYIGRSAELAKALFKELQPGQVAPKVYDVDGNFVVAKLISRTEPDMKKLEAERQTMAMELAEDKAARMVRNYGQRTCQAKRGDIDVVKTFVEYGEIDDKTGKRITDAPYVPCATSDDLASMLGGMGGVTIQ